MKRALLALYRWAFVREDRLSDAWLRDMAAAEGAEEFARDMDDSRIIQPRTVLDGPTSRYDRPVSR
jgi:hypothetical protein